MVNSEHHVRWHTKALAELMLGCCVTMPFWPLSYCKQPLCYTCTLAVATTVISTTFKMMKKKPGIAIQQSNWEISGTLEGARHKAILCNWCMLSQNNQTVLPHLIFLYHVLLLHNVFTQRDNSFPSKIMQDMLSSCINSVPRSHLIPRQIHNFPEIYLVILYRKSIKGAAGWGGLLVFGVFIYAAGEMKWFSSINQPALKKRNVDWQAEKGNVRVPGF